MNLIKIEIDFLIKHDLLIDEYFVLLSMFNSNYNKIINLVNDINVTLINLKHKNWLESDENGRFKLSNKAEQLFSDSAITKSFNKVYFLYPQKVFKKLGGIRILRTNSILSLEYAKCLDKYTKIVKSQPWLCDVIENCLKKQIEIARNSNSIEFMQEFEVWLNNNTWEKYMDITVDSSSESSERTDKI